MRWICKRCTCSNPSPSHSCKKCGGKLPKIREFAASESHVQIGFPIIFQWDVEDAGEIEIQPEIGAVTGKSFVDAFLKEGGTYSLIARNEIGSSQASLTLKLDKPEIIWFSASAAQTGLQDPVLLKWEVSNAEKVRLDPGIGEVETRGEAQVFPSQNTQYILTAFNAAGYEEGIQLVKILPPGGRVL